MKAYANESGAVLIIVTLMVMFFLGLSAVVVDAGYWYDMRRQLQAAADAGATAGTVDMILEKDDATIDGTARDYALKNAVTPVVDIDRDAIEVDVIGGEGVKVTVAHEAPLFFARLFTDEPFIIKAQAKAIMQPISAGIGLVPLALPIIEEASMVTVRRPDGTEVQLSDDDKDGTWEGNISFSQPANKRGYGLDVIAYNGQTKYPDGGDVGPLPTYSYKGVPDEITQAATVFVQNPGGPITGVSLEPLVLTFDDPTSPKTATLSVAATEEPRATSRGSGPEIGTFSEDSPGLWTATVEIPKSADDLIQTYGIDVETTSGGRLVDAAVLVVRRSTYPIENVVLNSSTFFNPGGSNQLSVSVTLHEYVVGELYVLKVPGGGGQIGNFMYLDFWRIKHPDLWRCNALPNEYTPEGPRSVRTFLGKPFPHAVHMAPEGDTICTQTGGATGQLWQGLDERFGGDEVPYSVWRIDRPPTKRVIYVPVVESLEIPKGEYPVRVVRFASFYVEPRTGGVKSPLRGYFINYVAPGPGGSEGSELCTDPDDPIPCYARLVSDGVEF